MFYVRMNALKPIVENTLKVVESKKRDRVYLKEIQVRIDSAAKTRPLAKAAAGNSIIAEVKFASPFMGEISNVKFEDVVKDYVDGGAAAISVLTEEKYFKGSLAFLETARSLATVPILMKDFILDKFQLWEARAFGADGVLLISGLLGDDLGFMIDYARGLDLWCLVETCAEEQISGALDAGAEIIGVNNRYLSTLEVELGTTVGLCQHIPENKTLVTESGINTPADIKKLKQECARKPDYYLIGTALMKARNRVEKLRELVKA